MIKCNECNVEIRGAKYMIMAELSMLVHALYSDVFIKDEGMEPEAARKEILSAVEIGFKADEDVSDEVHDLRSALEGLRDALKKCLERNGDC